MKNRTKNIFCAIWIILIAIFMALVGAMAGLEMR